MYFNGILTCISVEDTCRSFTVRFFIAMAYLGAQGGGIHPLTELLQIFIIFMVQWWFKTCILSYLMSNEWRLRRWWLKRLPRLWPPSWPYWWPSWSPPIQNSVYAAAALIDILASTGCTRLPKMSTWIGQWSFALCGPTIWNYSRHLLCATVGCHWTYLGGGSKSIFSDSERYPATMWALSVIVWWSI